ncbi:MAG: hypothetical protein LBT78_07290 [Tannerella sp.]|jgi:hypothetical protein|nr:hypothetical protein [Tannerella sp.]
MKKGICISGLMLTCLLALSAELAGQENRRWALRYAADVFDKPFLTHNPQRISTGNAHSAFALMGEYYLPDKWSLQAGYFNTEISYGNGGRLMEGLRLGIRRYFLNPDFIIQPYLSASGEINWGQHTEHRTYSGASTAYDYRGIKTDSYTGVQNTLNPRLSFVPGAGVEVYLFSSIAVFAEYNIGMGLVSHTTVETSWDDGRSYAIRDKGMYHSLSLGIKATFPFSFTFQDGETLWYFVTEALYNMLDAYNERHY